MVNFGKLVAERRWPMEAIQTRVATTAGEGENGPPSASDTEMGPALRPTPLSPACGPRRTLNAWRLSRGSPGGRSRYVARRSRRCRFRRGTDEIRRSRPNRPAVPRPVFRPGSSTGSAMRGIASPSEPAGKSGLPTLRPRGLNGLEVANIPKEVPRFHPSTARHLAVASKSVPKSLLLSGCYPVHPKSQSPLTMSGGCARTASRASDGSPSYPLSTLFPVDKGG